MDAFFHANESDRFTFYTTPKELFTEKFKNLSALAKLLYGMLLDRNSLSKKNNWVDSNGRVFIIFSREEVQELLCIGKNKPTQLFKELEKFDLIKEVRQGVNKPNIIYVKKVYLARTPENRESRIPDIGNQESPKQGGNNTELNDTDLNDTENIGNFDKQNPTYSFYSFKTTYDDIDESVDHYIEYYLSIKEEKYTVDKWLEIVENLERFLIEIYCFEDVRNIVKKYFKTKFEYHTLYHSSLENVLIHRLQEIGELSWVEE